DVFAGKKSAQIREILISESAWEEMTCLFAPSLYLPHITGFYCYFKRQKNALASIWLSFMAMSVHTKWKVIENSQLPGSYFLTILIQKAQKTQQIT
ncbi:hypothetical protein, partial [Klebsiella pneumoniae]